MKKGAIPRFAAKYAAKHAGLKIGGTIGSGIVATTGIGATTVLGSTALAKTAIAAGLMSVPAIGSSVTVLGSTTVGSAAVALGLVSAPIISPVLVCTIGGGLIVSYVWKKLFSPPSPKKIRWLSLSSVKLLGSNTLGSAAMSLGLVSAKKKIIAYPIYPDDEYVKVFGSIALGKTAIITRLISVHYR